MGTDRTANAALIMIAGILTCTALWAASTVFAPLAFALLIIAILWPLQKWLQSLMPNVVALIVTMAVLILSASVISSLIVWSFSRVGHAIAADAARFQTVYEQLRIWLEGHGIAVAALWAEHIDIGWYLRLARTILSRLNSTMSFWLVVIVYVTLGLLEVHSFANNIRCIGSGKVSRVLLDGSIATAEKIRSYFLVRTQMSVLTGLLFFLVTYAINLPLAMEWGIIAFVLNFIPFLGPLIAALFPTLYAMAELQTWQTAAFLFVLLNVIQIVLGSYVEPRVSGAILSISPPLVLFSVFFWAFLWGIFGAFIGVPISIAVLTYCSQSESTRWLSDLFSGDGKQRGRRVA